MIRITWYLIILFITTISFRADAKIEAEIEFETFVGKKYFNLETSAGVTYKHSNYYGSFLFFKTTSGNMLNIESSWSEIIAGMHFYPHKNITLSFGGGVEEDDALWRVMCSMSIKASFGKIFFAFEHGASGTWYGGEIEFHILHLLGAGVFFKNHDGIGPMLSVKMPEMPLSFFIAPLFNYNHKNFLAVIGMKGEI